MSEESKTPVKSWELPYMDKPGSEVDKARTNVFNRRNDWKYEPPEVEEEVFPPTAQEIEAIRAAAHADGFAQGQQEGKEQGIQEGQKQGYEAGLSTGLEEGTQQGLAAAQEEITGHINAMTEIVKHLQKPVANVDKILERELVQLAVSLARAVIRSEVKTNENLIFQALSEGLKVLPIQESRYQIHLHPQDLALVTAQFSPEEIEKQHWNFIENPQFNRGGCEVITESNAVDITIERRVRDVLDRFLLEQGLSSITTEVADSDL
ncbi:flagellar assembly protein FliH [Paraglaciecola sp. 25GB23A]|uniref:flagellar assembly protein FliH n=1 Tax=Paraglaciecola sp. 25GB23A TaxID=3156068 RepID=UPI0032AEAAB2